MEFKKCDRCGCFFVSQDSVCQNCMPKDRNEINRLKDFFESSSETYSINALSVNTGISEKNINRYLNLSDFSNITNQVDLNGLENTNIKL